MDWNCIYEPDGYGANSEDYNWTEIHSLSSDLNIYFYIHNIKKTNENAIYIPLATFLRIQEKTTNYSSDMINSFIKWFSLYSAYKGTGVYINERNLHTTLEISEQVKSELEELLNPLSLSKS